MLDADLIRADFPILERRTASGARVTYLDSTATSQKPLAVIEAMNDFYRRSNANIHRGVHTLAEESTALYEQAREKVAKFINAESARQIVYTRNTTESINLVAYTWARANLKAGDLIVLTEMEHHSNLVPWHMLAAERGVELDFIPVTADGLLDLDAYRSLLTRDPKLVAFTQMSNVLGTVNPAAEIVRLAREVGAATLVDAAQSAPHLAIDAQALGADFIAFSAHKMCG
ncbi:MAG: aminotransferase class V-fold PLP-dependent enzyme, partial [Anaerolineae bacterium]|nr:aminotransferase class V-fold PLP-dependent enzyme [Anaerolineae bacterium]